MSVVIVGGNDRMINKYKELCKTYSCKAKIFTQMPAKFSNQIGRPDLIVLFTNTVAHKMVLTAMSEAEKNEKTYQIDLMKVNNDIQRVEENKEISKKQLINDKIKVAGDVVRTVLSAGASIFLTRKILKVEDEGIVKTKKADKKPRKLYKTNEKRWLFI